VFSPGTFQIPAESINHTHVISSNAMIADAASLAGSGYAAVLGCGRCTEIPVRYLSTIFKRVDLVDIDSDALKSVEIQFREWGQAKNSLIICKRTSYYIEGLSPVKRLGL
jgi:hypothetical protein